MKEMRIVYIDDINDEILSRYMNQNYCTKPLVCSQFKKEIIKKYNEIKFNGELGYEDLLHNNLVRSANVVLIDNHLFEERTVGVSRFSGKQFKVILRKLLPYVEVIIITQDDALTGENIIHKFADRHGKDPNLYYQKYLDPILDQAIKSVLEFEALADDLKQSIDVEKTLVEKIIHSLQGDSSYDSLTKADIDNLIACFKELKDGCY